VPIWQKILDCFKDSTPSQDKAQNQTAAVRMCEYEGPAKRGVCQESLNVGGFAGPRSQIMRRQCRKNDDAQDHWSEDCRDGTKPTKYSSRGRGNGDCGRAFFDLRWDF